MSLPEGIPTVTVTGRYLFPDGRPLSGQIVWRAPALVTFADYDVILGGPVTVPLDEQGRFQVELPATDAPGMNPSGWSYSVAEQFAGVSQNRVYQVLLPAETPNVDIADIAPTDPTTPTYVAVRGDSAYEVAVAHGFVGTESEWLASLVGPQGEQGLTGATGAPGSQVYTGSTAPTADVGRDGDVYEQYTTVTNLGVTSTTVALWSKAAGTWSRTGGDIRGAQWYVNNAGTPSTGVPLGDMLLRSDTGDVYQRGASGWALQGNLKGPQGAQGPKGDQGAPGVVQSVNGQAVADVQLAAADVHAVPDTAPGAPNGVAQLDATGKVPAAQLPASSGGGVQTVNGKSPDGSGNVALAAADVGAVATTALGAASGVAQLGADGILASAQRPTYTAAQVGAIATTAKGAASGVAPLDSAADVPLANLPDAAIPASFNPADLGLKAWAFDPAVAISTTAFTGNGSLRFTAVVLRQTMTVSKIVFQLGGYAGTMNTGSWAAIYDSTGARKGTTADMAGEAVIPGVHNAGGAAVSAALTASVSLPAGLYYIGYVFRYSASDGPMLLQLENGAGAPPNVFGPSNVKRFGVYTATVPTSAPSSITLANIDNGANRFWAGLA